jgi:2-polyprenyl-3-methyl-5-hydroxy-6-metoxy-1,4-benzoquinol methylase
MPVAIRINRGLDEPWRKLWPAGGLESVELCPVCGHDKRSLLYRDLVDDTFRAAPGSWSLWQCSLCHSAYLNPRPTRDAIHLAYANYYTHKQPEPKADYAALRPIFKVRRRLLNGYTNWRYGTGSSPSSKWGILAALALPGARKIPDLEFRHLPKLYGGGGRLLDVGCGDGTFLRQAQSCGWDVVGLDTDTAVVASAVQQGLAVFRGGIEYFAEGSDMFDVITLNHVIEHLHDPVQDLSKCYTLLKSGGQLWIETPNVESSGHALFQRHWRGLEVPRHLVLFNQRSLRKLLSSIGFQQLKELPRYNQSRDIYASSYAISQGIPLCQAGVMPFRLRLLASLTKIADFFPGARHEFLTLSGQKPKNLS